MPSRKKFSVVPYLIVGVLMLPALFVLSMGPYYWLANHGYVSESVGGVMEDLYFPLRWCSVHSHTFADVVEWYGRLWL